MAQVRDIYGKERAAFAPVEALTGFDDLQELHGLFYNWNNAIEKGREEAYRSSKANIKAGGTAAKIVDTVGTTFVAALPQAIMAIMSAGTSLGAFGAKGLEATALAARQSPGILSPLQSASVKMANNPNFWTSFLRTAGESYEQARADGADDGKASLYAVSNALLNATLEVGGESEAPLQGGTSAARQWLEGSLREGLEEPVQGAAERGLQSLVYGKKNPLFSTKDETAVINPKTALKEFGVGTAVGAALDGGRLAAERAKIGLAFPNQRVYNHGKPIETEGSDNGDRTRGERTQGRAAAAAVEDSAGSVQRAQVFDGKRPGIPEARSLARRLGDVWSRHGRLNVAQEAKKSLKSSYNVRSHIVPNGKWNGDYFAYSRNGEVFLQETVPEEYRGMLAPHEGTHLMKQFGYKPYLDFLDRTPQMLDMSNPTTLKLLSEIAGRRGIVSPDATDKEVTTLYDELNATLYGHIASGNMPQYMRDALDDIFYDFDSYAASLAALHDGFQESRKQTGYILYSPNAVKPYAGTPGDYAALLKRLAEERGERETLTAERRRALAAWNLAFPELHMSEREFLAR